MQIKLLVSAAAIALVVGLGSASASEKFTTLDGISAFDSLAGIQAVPLDTAEMASVTGAHYLRIDLKTDMLILLEGHKNHKTHTDDDGVKYPRGGGLFESSDVDWSGSAAEVLHDSCLVAPCAFP